MFIIQLVSPVTAVEHIIRLLLLVCNNDSTFYRTSCGWVFC